MGRAIGWQFLFSKNTESGSFHDENGNEWYFYDDGSGYYHGADGSDGYKYSDGSGYYHGADGTDGYKYSDGSGYYRGSDGTDAYQYSDGSGYYRDSDGNCDNYSADDEDNANIISSSSDLSPGASVAALAVGLGVLGLGKLTEAALEYQRKEQEEKAKKARKRKVFWAKFWKKHFPRPSRG